MPDLSALTGARGPSMPLRSTAETVTTFGGDPALAKSDPSNTAGLVIVTCYRADPGRRRAALPPVPPHRQRGAHGARQWNSQRRVTQS